MSRPLGYALVAALFVSAVPVDVRADSLVLAGPGQFQSASVSPARDPGLCLTVLEDVSLITFDFNSRGRADTVVLSDLEGNILHTQKVAAGPGLRSFEVNWDLDAGKSYRLASLTHYNALWARRGTLGSSNLHLTVDGAIDKAGRLYSNAWFGFSNLETVSLVTASAALDQPIAVPVPAAAWGGFALLGGLSLVRRLRRLRDISGNPAYDWLGRKA